jgi:glutamate---cysteine ligase / carboxylate-amine ligase
MSSPVKINTKRPLSLFEGYGVELEYIIADSETLDVKPVSDRLLEKAAGKIVNEHSFGCIAWSNELVLHVIEIKTDGPAVSLEPLHSAFMGQVRAIEKILERFGARLMPGAIHPWMNPITEVQLWPHEQNLIYEAYHRIFDCRGHGWANLQSTHLNLPFDGDEEFGKLHAATRLVLPLIPAVAASSPIADAEQKPFLDYRMEMYRTNSVRIPSVTGKIVPEPVFSKSGYEQKIFQPMYREIAPFDTDGILQEEWLNSRGAMSRWDRQTIEIRVIDNQEYPGADIAVLEWVVNLTKALVDEKWATRAEQQAWSETELYHILMKTIKLGDQAVIQNADFLSLFGLREKKISAGELCHYLFDELKDVYLFSETSEIHLNLIFEKGPLARRILNALPNRFTKPDLFNIYTELCNSLRDGRSFQP